MKTIIIRVLVNAAAIWVATVLVPGVDLEATSTGRKVVSLLLVAAVFGIINAFIKPVVKLFAVPLFILTLGLITFVINALMLELTSYVAGRADLGFHVDDFFWSAILGAIVISIVSWILSAVQPD